MINRRYPFWRLVFDFEETGIGTVNAGSSSLGNGAVFMCNVHLSSGPNL
jgi:hypothetical protein